MQPLVLYKANVWKNAHRRVLLLFVPITLVSTPLGQLVSDGVPTNIVQAVAGVLVTFVACWELYSKRNWFLRLLSLCNTEKKDKDGQSGAVDTAEIGEVGVEEAGDDSNEKKEETLAMAINPDAITQLDSESLGKVATIDATNDGNNEEPARKEQTVTATAILPKTTISSVYASLAAEPNNNIGISTIESSPQANNKPAI